MGRTDRLKSRTRQCLRKRFRGNQYTRKTEEKQQQALTSQEDYGDDMETPSHGPKSISMSASNLETPINTTSSISNSKVENIPTDTPKQNDPKITGYRFIDIEIPLDVIEILCCPEYGNNNNTHKS